MRKLIPFLMPIIKDKEANMKLRSSYVLRAVFRAIITFLLFAVPFGSTFIPAGPRAITITVYLAVVLFEIVRAIRITHMDKKIISVNDINVTDLRKEFVREIEFSLVAGFITLFIFFGFTYKGLADPKSTGLILIVLLTWFAAIAVIVITPLVLLSRTFGSFLASNVDSDLNRQVKKFNIKLNRLMKSFAKSIERILIIVKKAVIALANELKENTDKLLSVSLMTSNEKNTDLITQKKKATLPPVFNF